MVCSIDFDGISKDFNFAIDAECFYYKYKIVQYNYQFEDSTHERFLKGLDKHQEN